MVTLNTANHETQLCGLTFTEDDVSSMGWVGTGARKTRGKGTVWEAGRGKGWQGKEEEEKETNYTGRGRKHG